MRSGPNADTSSGGSDARSGTGDASAADAGASDAGPDGATAPSCITPTTPQSCTAPVMTALPLCKLSQTGCMDATDPTKFTANAVYYEVNSPLWSDGAAKTRAFVMPDGGTIHVKNCAPDAGATELADCVSSMGIPNGPADTGKWVFPVGTVMIKNFMFDGKIVETRLFMRVDAATASLVNNGTDWVGYNYAWNEQQTEATVLSGARTAVAFDTGKQTVAWNYPGFNDCIGCHSQPVGTIGPETAQMNREVDGGNQIDAFIAKKLFDKTAPTKPYAAATVEPYANAALGLAGPLASATLDEKARSYLERELRLLPPARRERPRLRPSVLALVRADRHLQSDFAERHPGAREPTERGLRAGGPRLVVSLDSNDDSGPGLGPERERRRGEDAAARKLRGRSAGRGRPPSLSCGLDSIESCPDGGT